MINRTATGTWSERLSVQSEISPSDRTARRGDQDAVFYLPSTFPSTLKFSFVSHWICGACERAPKGFIQTYTMRKASGKPWNRGGYGMEFHGTNGRMLVTRNGWTVEGDLKDEKQPALGQRIENFDKKGKDSHPEHALNFLDCMRTRNKPVATIESHYKTVKACHLANVSLRVGRKIFWDDQKELCYKDRELKEKDKDANKLLAREYRKGYELPKV